MILAKDIGTHTVLKLINFRKIAKGVYFNNINIEYQYQISNIRREYYQYFPRVNA